jgi:hypothetical protein
MSLPSSSIRVVVDNGPTARVPVYVDPLDAACLPDWEKCSPEFRAVIRYSVKKAAAWNTRERAPGRLSLALLVSLYPLL